MKPASVFAIAFLLLVLPIATGAQTVPNQPPGAHAAPPISPAAAPQAPGGPDAASDLDQSQALGRRIEAARKAGKDVGNAEAEKKLGDAALAAGYKSQAAEHYTRANQEIGTTAAQ